jgi:hypothetical protein
MVVCLPALNMDKYKLTVFSGYTVHFINPSNTGFFIEFCIRHIHKSCVERVFRCGFVTVIVMFSVQCSGSNFLLRLWYVEPIIVSNCALMFTCTCCHVTFQCLSHTKWTLYSCALVGVLQI